MAYLIEFDEIIAHICVLPFIEYWIYKYGKPVLLKMYLLGTINWNFQAKPIATENYMVYAPQHVSSVVEFR